VEEQEEERDVNALGRQAVGVATAIALQQAVAFELDWYPLHRNRTRHPKMKPNHT
jgi:hypothetical protein